MRTEPGPWTNPLRFDADDLAFFLVEGNAAADVEAVLALPFGRALDQSVRIQHRYQVQTDALRV